MASTGRGPSSGITHQGATEGPKREPKEIARLVGAAIILVYLIAFIVENSQSVEVHFVFWTAHVSLIWALLIAAVLGVVLDRLVILRRRQQQRHKAETQP
jgi:uncharacterized integral membrane protein